MRIKELVDRQMRTYRVRIKLKQPGGYTQQMYTTVVARNPEQARRIIRAQYGTPSVLVGQPKELK